VATDANAHDLNAVVVQLARTGDGGGLLGEYFADPRLGERVATRVENPAALRWDGAPATGVPADSFSARWSGDVTPPADGTYRYCVYADDGVRLWVGGRLLVDAWLSAHAERCADVEHAAGRRQPLRLEYREALGAGVVRLSWRPPGRSAQETIPTARLQAPGADVAAPSESAPAPATASPSPAAPSATGPAGPAGAIPAPAGRPAAIAPKAPAKRPSTARRKATTKRKPVASHRRSTGAPANRRRTGARRRKAPAPVSARERALRRLCARAARACARHEGRPGGRPRPDAQRRVADVSAGRPS
jgi:hypothetical protein